jgi:hypothetical protein
MTEVCSAFTIPEYLPAQQDAVAALEGIADTARSLSSLPLGTVHVASLDFDSLGNLIMDNIVSRFEEIANTAIMQATGKDKILDLQDIRETLMNVPTVKTMQGRLEQRSRHKKKLLKIDITAEQIKQAMTAGKYNGFEVVDAALKLGYLTKEQAWSVLLDVGYGKNPGLEKWSQYFEWKEDEVDKAKGYFDIFARGRNALCHGENITLAFFIPVMKGFIGLLGLLHVDCVSYSAMLDLLEDIIKCSSPGLVDVPISVIDISSDRVRIPYKRKDIFGRQELVERLMKSCSGKMNVVHRKSIQ